MFLQISVNQITQNYIYSSNSKAFKTLMKSCNHSTNNFTIPTLLQTAPKHKKNKIERSHTSKTFNLSNKPLTTTVTSKNNLKSVQNIVNNAQKGTQTTIKQDIEWISRKYPHIEVQHKQQHTHNQSKHNQYNAELINENQRLKTKIQYICVENMEIKQQNKKLIHEINYYVNQLKGKIDINSIDVQIKQFSNFQNYSKNSMKQPQPIQQGDGTQTIINHYINLCQSLSQEIKFLYDIKNNLEERLQKYSQQYHVQVQSYQSLKKEYQHMQQQVNQQKYNNQQLLQKLQKLEEVVENAHQQIIDMRKVKRQEQQQYQQLHRKFHLQMEKMREKNQKYKLRSQQYRQQRDQLAVQIQQARLQLQGTTARQYFPKQVSFKR